MFKLFGLNSKLTRERPTSSRKGELKKKLPAMGFRACVGTVSQPIMRAEYSNNRSHYSLHFPVFDSMLEVEVGRWMFNLLDTRLLARGSAISLPVSVNITVTTNKPTVKRGKQTRNCDDESYCQL